MLQAMNTGHDGSLSTIHANSPRDALARVETMVLMAGYDLPVKAIRQQVASALDLIIQLERLQDGSRRVVSITEVGRMESDVVTLSELFRFKVDGVQAGPHRGRAACARRACARRSSRSSSAAGSTLPHQLFANGRGVGRPTTSGASRRDAPARIGPRRAARSRALVARAGDAPTSCACPRPPTPGSPSARTRSRCRAPCALDAADVQVTRERPPGRPTSASPPPPAPRRAASASCSRSTPAPACAARR